MHWGAALLIIATACGRVGFDAADDSRIAAITLRAGPQAGPGSVALPAFDADVHSYRFDVGLGLQHVSVAAVPVADTTTIEINGELVRAGMSSSQIPIALGSNTITIVGTSLSGASTTYTIDVVRAQSVAQQVYLKASNAEAFDEFGYAVAVSGDTLVVGGRMERSGATGVNGEQADNASTQAGAVYVFVRSGDTWIQQAYLKASNTEPTGATGDRFGSAVAISDDTLVVTARFEASSSTGVNGNQVDNLAVDAGAAYVFVRSGSTWTQQAYLKASNTGAGDELGYAVAIDNDTIAIGAHLEDSSATSINGDQTNDAALESGAVYVFTRAAGAWSQQAYIKGSRSTTGDQFGRALALAGNRLVVGAWFDGTAAPQAGAVYIFQRTDITWSETGFLTAPNADANDRFGVAVDVDGPTLVVGAWLEASGATGVDGDALDNSQPDAGAVYVYERSNNIYMPTAYLKASNTDAGDQFGFRVAMSGDTIVVGAIGEKSLATGVDGNQADNSSPVFGASGPGAVYLFSREGTSWAQRAYVKASNTDVDADEFGDQFGTAIAIDGETIAVGALYEDSAGVGVGGAQSQGGAANSGAVYLFR